MTDQKPYPLELWETDDLGPYTYFDDPESFKRSVLDFNGVNYIYPGDEGYFEPQVETWTLEDPETGLYSRDCDGKEEVFRWDRFNCCWAEKSIVEHKEYEVSKYSKGICDKVSPKEFLDRIQVISGYLLEEKDLTIRSWPRGGTREMTAEAGTYTFRVYALDEASDEVTWSISASLDKWTSATGYGSCAVTAYRSFADEHTNRILNWLHSLDYPQD